MTSTPHGSPIPPAVINKDEARDCRCGHRHWFRLDNGLPERCGIATCNCTAFRAAPPVGDATSAPTVCPACQGGGTEYDEQGVSWGCSQCNGGGWILAPGTPAHPERASSLIVPGLSPQDVAGKALTSPRSPVEADAPEEATDEPLASLERKARTALASANPRNHDGLRIAVRPHDLLSIAARVSQLEATVAELRTAQLPDGYAFWRETARLVGEERDAEHTARLAAEQETDRLRAALQAIAEPSSYPIDPADAFSEAMERAKAALRGPVA